MGFAITWLACPEKKADEILKRLSLSATGEATENPDAPISMLRLNPQWRIIWIREYCCDFLQPRDMAKLSHDAEIVMCLIEEHVMASSAEQWSQGWRTWRVEHQGDNGPFGLETGGKLPASFAAIRASAERDQEEAGGDIAEVDCIFDIPLKVAESVVGFRHDTLTEGKFEVLQRAEPKSAGFFKRLFGR